MPEQRLQKARDAYRTSAAYRMTQAQLAVDSATAVVLGCGRKAGGPGVVTLDRDASLGPDYVCTLGVEPLPFAENSLDSATAIHVLEHIGRQGETREWFYFWEELYRVLKPGGTLLFESPMHDSVWAWADPTHTRALSPEAFVFFSQDSYRIADSAISPYRIRCDFVPLRPYELIGDNRGGAFFRGVLQAKKPLRPWWES